MSRRQLHSQFAARHVSWPVIVLCGALSGCGSNATATNSVDVRAESVTEPVASPKLADSIEDVSDTVEISVPDPSPDEPVTAMMTIRPHRASAGDTVEMLVHIRIARAHYIHAADAANGPFVPVAVNAELPEGVELVGDWHLPTPEKGRGNSLVYRNSILLRRSLKVVSNSPAETVTVTGELQYQVCTAEICWPQGTLELSAPLTILPPPR